MRKESLLDQARDQIISGLHAGLLRHGQRLPALRWVATLSGLNVKTVMRLYASLQREGLVEIRKGSGAFVTVQEPDELEPAQAAGVGRFLRRHLNEASGMNITPGAYATLVQRLVTRCSLEGKAVAVLECNRRKRPTPAAWAGSNSSGSCTVTKAPLPLRISTSPSRCRLA